MAGIGFRLNNMARGGGLVGIAGAAGYGALISAGPWLLTVLATIGLETWTKARLAPGQQHDMLAVTVYCFCLSAVAASPVNLLSVRLVADRLFVKDQMGVPALLLGGIAAASLLALVLGSLVFGALCALSFIQASLAILLVIWLTQIWVISPLLTAIEQYRIIFLAYAAGAAVAGGLLATPVERTLAAVCAGTGVTLAILLVTLRRYFCAPLGRAAVDLPGRKTFVLMIAAGFASTAAIWIDKWLLWFAPGSVAAAGSLRVNPINDHGSFLGLLTIVPGMALILIVTETRFDHAFRRMLSACTGTATLTAIEQARRGLAGVIFYDLRLTVILQSLIVGLSWVFAVPLFDLLGADTRGIFAFRNTVIGVLFHLVVLQKTIYLAYYDLFGCILLVWTSFCVTSGLMVWAQWQLGVAGFGLGYMAGAIVAAAVALTMVSKATQDLTYLLFVGNNPSMVGSGHHRLWI
ncbi:exopolysaccharide Pel transporter PelG [Novosphingobium cyanobacteriorum]|uniref:Exopolysaccharide Pel transporter PelG n=1 Tax=Novosphingobium cyanobacteriorum TaxID=3024215 RepID=A0ABT6CS71_9SPHN|nr:exopolysaccharide Pel transporter PelG [Novosphingobium cyanobacteriorum]MDF8335537.1 exopolysaccharide Pel transporter PelG [Novosphingobium cyanobacteriorum]